MRAAGLQVIGLFVRGTRHRQRGRLSMTELQYQYLRDALASARIEGHEITKQTVQDCIRLIDGEISVADMIQEFKARYC